jgi:hypothetical protein
VPQQPNTRISVGQVQIAGAPAATRRRPLESAVFDAVSTAFAASVDASPEPRTVDVRNLRVRVRSGATERDLARAIVDALRRARDGRAR